MPLVKFANGKTISVTCPFDDGIELLQEAITQDQSGGIYGATWPLACAFVRSGVDWSGWRVYHTRLRKAYQSKLGGEAEYRETQWSSEKERKAIMWSRHDVCRSLVKAHYFPEDVVLPNYVEGSPAIPSVIRMTAINRGLSEEHLEGWFLKSFDSQQFHLVTSSDHDPLTWHAMKDAGLAVSSEKIDPYEGLSLLNISELRSVLKRFNLPAARSLSEAKRIIATRITRNDLKLHLIEETLFGSYWKVLPPDGISWADFQSWRQQIKGMGGAISDIFSGTLKKNHLDYIDLCC